MALGTVQTSERAFRLQSVSVADHGPQVVSDRTTGSPATGSVRGLPFFVFCLYTFVLIGRPQDFLPLVGSLRPVLVLTLVALAVTIPRWRRTRPSPLRRVETRLYLLFFAVMVAGVPFSLHRGMSFQFVTGYAMVNGFFYLAFLLHVDSVARVRRLLQVLMFTLLVFSVVGLLTGNNTNGRFSVQGGMFDANDTAFVVISLLPYSLCVLLGSFRKSVKLFALGSVASGLLLALYTGSRGGMVGLLVFVLLFLFVRLQGVSKVRKIMALCLLGVVGLVNLGRIDVDRYLTLTNLEEDYNTTEEQGRLEVWRKGLQIFTDRPLTGVGVGRFGEAIGTLRLQENTAPRWQAAHNSYLQVLTETGIFGGCALLLLLLICLKTFRGLARRAASSSHTKSDVVPGLLLTGFMTQLLVAFFLSHGYSLFLTLSIAMAVALKGIAAAEAEKGRPTSFG